MNMPNTDGVFSDLTDITMTDEDYDAMIAGRKHLTIIAISMYKDPETLMFTKYVTEACAAFQGTIAFGHQCDAHNGTYLRLGSLR